MNRKIALTISALALALTSLAGCATDERPSLTVPATCQEDEPCWECHSIGNRVCGPANDAERAAGWDVWEYGNGAHSLKIDTSRPFRVDYVGNAIDYPRNLRPNDLVLVGKDFKWYVFRAVPTDGATH